MIVKKATTITEARRQLIDAALAYEKVRAKGGFFTLTEPTAEEIASALGSLERAAEEFARHSFRASRKPRRKVRR